MTVPNDMPDAEAAVLLMKSMGAELLWANSFACCFFVPKQSILLKKPVRLAQAERIFDEILGCKLLIQKQ